MPFAFSARRCRVDIDHIKDLGNNATSIACGFDNVTVGNFAVKYIEETLVNSLMTAQCTSSKERMASNLIPPNKNYHNSLKGHRFAVFSFVAHGESPAALLFVLNGSSAISCNGQVIGLNLPLDLKL